MRPAEAFIQQPVRSLQTMLRVIAVDDPNLPILVPDGIYGPSTMNAVTAFQRREGIPVTGITDENTWIKITQAYEPALIRTGKAEPIEILLEPGQIILPGESNPYIFLTQGMLAQLAKDHAQIPHTNSTGMIDSETEFALRAFQNLAGLPSSGALDRITWKHLVHQFTLSVSRNSVAEREI